MVEPVLLMVLVGRPPLREDCTSSSMLLGMLSGRANSSGGRYVHSLPRASHKTRNPHGRNGHDSLLRAALTSVPPYVNIPIALEVGGVCPRSPRTNHST